MDENNEPIASTSRGFRRQESGVNDRVTDAREPRAATSSGNSRRHQTLPASVMSELPENFDEMPQDELIKELKRRTESYRKEYKRLKRELRRETLREQIQMMKRAIAEAKRDLLILEVEDLKRKKQKLDKQLKLFSADEALFRYPFRRPGVINTHHQNQSSYVYARTHRLFLDNESSSSDEG